MSIDHRAAVVTGMENVLAAHNQHYTAAPYAVCSCDKQMRTYKDHAAHVAEALTLAGVGNLHDAWAEGVEAGQNYDDIYPGDNPYPAPKVSET